MKEKKQNGKKQQPAPIMTPRIDKVARTKANKARRLEKARREANKPRKIVPVSGKLINIYAVNKLAHKPETDDKVKKIERVKELKNLSATLYTLEARARVIQ
jgi:hypothetical protein